jgi:Zn-dependent protease
MTGVEAPTPRGGLRLGRVVGVPVLIGPSWFLMAALVTLGISGTLSASIGATQATIVGASFAVLLGVSVLLHELGHCFVARGLGMPVRSITIGVMGGATQVEEAQSPAREYAVAIAGPMVSLLLAGTGVGLRPLFEGDSLAGRLVDNLAITNGLIAVFNLLPGLPLDGGRVLRAVLWQLGGDEHRATRLAAWAGRGVAVVVVPLVFIVVLPWAGWGSDYATNVIWSALIGGYIYALATLALKRSEAMERLPKVSVVGLARPAIRVLADTPLSEAVRQAHEANAQGIVVVDAADRVEAVVSEAAVIATPVQRRPWVTVGALSKRIEPGLVLDVTLTGEALLDAMRAHPSAEYVTQDPATGEVRVLSADDVAKVLSS